MKAQTVTKTELKEVLPGKQDGLDIELRDLYAANGKYTPEQKIETVMAYMVTGTSRKASKLCNVPENTIRWWKSQSSWWQEVMAECRRKKQDELDATFSRIIELGTDGVEDRLINGNTVIDKDGNQYQVPMSGKDIGWILGVIFDKRQLLRGDPTSRVEKVTEQGRLDRLMEHFETMARKVNEKDITNVQYEEITNGQKSQ